MNGTILKYLLLTFVILGNLYAFYEGIPFESLMNIHLMLAVSLLSLLFLSRRDNYDTIVNLLLLAFLFILFNKLKIGIKVPKLPNLSVERIILILISLFFVAEFLLVKRRRLLISSMEMAMIFVSGYIIFSMLAAGTTVSKEGGVSMGAFLNAYGIPFFMYFISKNVITDEKAIKKFFFFLSLIGLYLGLTGIFEYFNLKQFIFPRMIALEWVGKFHGRARGPFLQAAVNGTVIGMIIFTTFLLFLFETSRLKKTFYIISLMCMTVTLLLTLTRSSWLAFLIAIFVVPIFIPRLRRVFVSSLIILIVLSFILSVFVTINIRTFKTETDLYAEDATLIEKIVHRYKAKSSVEGRFDLLKMSFILFLEKPLFGHGYGALNELTKEYGISIQQATLDIDISRIGSIHDTTVSNLVELGLVGAGLYLFIIFYILNGYRKMLHTKFQIGGFLGKELTVMCLGTFIVFFVNAQLIDMRYFLFPNSLFFCISGIMAGLHHRISRDEINHSYQISRRNQFIHGY